jgi:capsular polysaccharide biosynthesis protein
MPYYDDALHLKKDTYYMPPLFTAVLTSVQYCSAYDVVLNKKKEIVRESSCTMDESKHFDLRCFYGVPRKRISGYCTALRSVSNNYYNLLIRNLPRLFALHQKEYANLKRIKLLIVDQLRGAESHFLAKICPQNVEIEFIRDRHLYEIEKFVYTPFLTQQSSGYLPKPYLSFFHERVLPKRTRRKKERIFVSREKTAMRRILNENVLFRRLKKLHFKKYILENMSFEDQIELFYDAECVVAPHGAGLTNLIFSDQVKVLEIFPFRFVKPTFYYLSKCMGHDYHYVCGESDWINDDFEVRVSEVCKAVENKLCR